MNKLIILLLPITCYSLLSFPPEPRLSFPRKSRIRRLEFHETTSKRFEQLSERVDDLRKRSATYSPTHQDALERLDAHVQALHRTHEHTSKFVQILFSRVSKDISEDYLTLREITQDTKKGDVPSFDILSPLLSRLIQNCFYEFEIGEREADKTWNYLIELFLTLYQHEHFHLLQRVIQLSHYFLIRLESKFHPAHCLRPQTTQETFALYIGGEQYNQQTFDCYHIPHTPVPTYDEEYGIAIANRCTLAFLSHLQKDLITNSTPEKIVFIKWLAMLTITNLRQCLTPFDLIKDHLQPIRDTLSAIRESHPHLHEDIDRAERHLNTAQEPKNIIERTITMDDFRHYREDDSQEEEKKEDVFTED